MFEERRVRVKRERMREKKEEREKNLTNEENLRKRNI
jgi:hypothetical protein